MSAICAVSSFSPWIDGPIVLLYLALTVAAGLWVKRWVKRVDHFLVAGRKVDVHLGIASLAATEFGIVTCMYTAQAGYQHGFAGAVPGLIQFVAMLVVGVTGFCVKPLRDQAAATLPELFENRFGRRVRMLAGIVIVLGGLLNMGLYLRLGGEFLVLTTGIDARWLTLVMGALLAVVVLYTALGGMLSVLVTDFLQFVVMSVGILAVTALVLWKVGPSTLVDTVSTRIGDRGFSPLADPSRGATFVLFQCFLQLAATLTWQPVVARVLAAKDSATGRAVYVKTSFFFAARFVLPGLWGIAALAMLAPVAGADPSVESIEAMPRFLATFLPVGLMGLMIAAMLAADMSTDSSYLVTWSGVLWNDVVEPTLARKGRVLTERAKLAWNRVLVVLLGLFLFFYGLWFPLSGDLWDYFAVTGSIYLSSMSVLLVAACYWRGARGAGALAAIVIGAAFPVAWLVLDKTPATHAFAASVGPHWSGIAAYAGAALAMLFGSALARRREVAR